MNIHATEIGAPHVSSHIRRKEHSLLIEAVNCILILVWVTLYSMKRIDLVNSVRSRISTIYTPEEARVVAYVVAERFYGFTLAQSVADPYVEIDAYDEGLIEEVCAQLLLHRPLQYVTGETEFCGMRFSVKEGVLIPRPETEELVRLISSERGGKAGLRVLDVGTGSGAIAVALAKTLCTPVVDAVDISQDALAIARGNASDNGVDVTFVLSDALLSPDKFRASLPHDEYDIIVSNPPYIPASEYEFMRDNVRKYEPATALFVEDSDPLLFYREIGEKAVQLLRSGGRLYFEIHAHFATEMVDLLVGLGFVDVECLEDMNGKARMTRCTKR